MKAGKPDENNGASASTPDLNLGSNQERLYGVWKILCEVLVVEINKNFVNHKKKDLRMFTLT